MQALIEKRFLIACLCFFWVFFAVMYRIYSADCERLTEQTQHGLRPLIGLGKHALRGLLNDLSRNKV